MKRYRGDQISPARRCAQIRQIIRLGNCPHPDKSLDFIFNINNGEWVEWCTDCNKITERRTEY